MRIINRTGNPRDTIIETNNGDNLEGVQALKLTIDNNRPPEVELTLDYNWLEYEFRQAVLHPHSLEIVKQIVRDFCLDCGASYEHNSGGCNCKKPL